MRERTVVPVLLSAAFLATLSVAQHRWVVESAAELRVTAKLRSSATGRMEEWTISVVNVGTGPTQVVAVEPTCDCVEVVTPLGVHPLRPGAAEAIVAQVTERPVDPTIRPGVRIVTDDIDRPVVWLELAR